MTIDEILEQAKTKYKIGDVIHNMYYCTFTINNLNFFKSDNKIWYVCPAKGSYTLYEDGLWAGILKTKKEINVFVGIKNKQNVCIQT